MVAFDVYDKNKNKTDTIELDDSVFAATVNDYLLHQVMVAYEANKRQGTVQTKTRNTIRGGGQKPYRQKGTGRARQGTTRAPHHRGGATQFGPSPRSYRQDIPRNMKRAAYRQCLSMKVNDGALFVLDNLDFEEIKTKNAANILKAFDAEGVALFVDVNPKDNTLLSIRNLADASIICVNECSSYNIFKADHLFVTKSAIEILAKRYAKSKGVDHAA